MDQTAVVEASPWDKFFSGLAGSATTLIDAYTQAEIDRLNPPNQQPQYMFGGTGGGTAGGMNGTVMLGLGLGLGLLVVLVLARRGSNANA